MKNLENLITSTGISVFSFTAIDEYRTDNFIRSIIQNEFFIINSSDYDQVIKIVNEQKNKVIYIIEPIQSFLRYDNSTSPMSSGQQLTKFIRILVKICNYNNVCIILKSFTHKTISNFNVNISSLPNSLKYDSSFICHIDDNNLEILKARYSDDVPIVLDINIILRKEKLIRIKNSNL